MLLGEERFEPLLLRAVNSCPDNRAREAIVADLLASRNPRLSGPIAQSQEWKTVKPSVDGPTWGAKRLPREQ